MKKVKCGKGTLLVEDRPLHLKCNTPGILLRWFLKLKTGQFGLVIFAVKNINGSIIDAMGLVKSPKDFVGN